MKHLSILGAGLLLSLLATTAPAQAQNYGRWSQHQQDQSHQSDSGNDQQDWHDNGRHADERSRNDEHLSRREQERLIRDEERRRAAYRKNLAEEQARAKRVAEELRQQNRAAQYRQHQDYLERLRAQQQAVSRRYDYRSDPYYSTPPSFRYNRDGVSYQTNQYGAEVLRGAVNAGYSEGFRNGQAGRQDRWHGDYRDIFAYRDANYGYQGRYVSQSEYNYYFRQGFQRGYRDGYDNTRRYGDRNNSILGAALSQILNLQSVR